MSSIALVMEESESSIISGFPEFVTFEVSEPATIFYTLDGSTPSELSEIVINDKLYLPTDKSYVTLKAVAITSTSSSPLVEMVYQIPILKDRFAETKTGVSVLPAGKDYVTSLAVNADGDDVQKTSKDIHDLDITASRTSDIGEKNAQGLTSKAFIYHPERRINFGDHTNISSPNDLNDNFNPEAKLIIINSQTQEDIDDQAVRIIMRPFDSIPVRSETYKEHIRTESLMTGSLILPIFNPDTGVGVFYYAEPREGRWVKSIVKTDPKELNLSSSLKTVNFAFRWITDRTQSKITR